MSQDTDDSTTYRLGYFLCHLIPSNGVGRIVNRNISFYRFKAYHALEGQGFPALRRSTARFAYAQELGWWYNETRSVNYSRTILSKRVAFPRLGSTGQGRTTRTRKVMNHGKWTNALDMRGLRCGRPELGQADRGSQVQEVMKPTASQSMNEEQKRGEMALSVVDIQRYKDIGSRIDKALFIATQSFYAHSFNQPTCFPQYDKSFSHCIGEVSSRLNIGLPFLSYNILVISNTRRPLSSIHWRRVPGVNSKRSRSLCRLSLPAN